MMSTSSSSKRTTTRTTRTADRRLPSWLALLAVASSCLCTSAAAYEFGDGDLSGHYFTYPQANGNRVIDPSVRGTFPNKVQTYDVNLPADVTWAVASHSPEAGFKYVVTTAEDKAYVIHPSTKQGAPATMEEIVDFQAGGDQPPLVRHKGLSENPVIITLPAAAKLSPLSHPVPAGEDVYAYIDTAGDFVLYNLPNSQEVGRMAGVNALPDARIVRSINGHMRPWLAFYAGATDYPNSCVLGDCIEGSRLLIVRVHPELGTIDTFADVQLPTGDVFEGISPMFLPDDTVVATVSNPTTGSMMVKYNWEGDEVSKSPAMGWNGWRHQLFYNDFGTPDGPLPLLADLRGPNAKKFLQFYDISFAPIWSMRAKIEPYSTQNSGTRVVDTNLSGDLNGDGIAEAVVPTENRDHIAGVQLRDQGDGTIAAEEVWRMELTGPLTSNVAAAATTDGTQGIAMGAASGKVFRLWVPLLDDNPSAGGAITGNSPTPTPPPILGDGPLTEDPTGEPTSGVASGGAIASPTPTLPPILGDGPLTEDPTGEPTYIPTGEPTYVPTAATDAPAPTRAPTRKPTLSAAEQELAMQKEMEEQFEEFEEGLVREEEAQSKKQAALLGSILGVSVVLVGLLGIIFGRRRASGKEMDTAKGPQTTFNKHGVLDGMNDLELAADADMHANEEEEEADEDMLSVNLDRNGVI